MNIDKHRDKLIARLKDKEHRDAFVSAHIQIGIPFQIRALREQRGWTQKELADHAGVKQAWIAQVENPNYQGSSLKTLLKLASAFDIGLIVRFAPFGELVKMELSLSPEKLEAISFDEDPYFKETPQHFKETPQPPVTHFVAQGGIILCGEGIANFINPSQPSIPSPLGAKPTDELSKYREAKQQKAKQKEAEQQLAKLSRSEKVNETAFG